MQFVDENSPAVRGKRSCKNHFSSHHEYPFCSRQ